VPRRLSTILMAVITAVVAWAPSALAEVQRPAGTDDALRKELDSDLFEGLENIPARRPTPPNEADPANAGTTPSGERPKPPPGEGEDIELGPQVDPLTRIGRRMKAVQERIAARDTSRDTQNIQDGIVQDLAALLEELQKAGKQPSPSPSQNAATPQRTTVDQPGPQQGQPSDTPSENPARESVERLGNVDPAAAEAERLQALLKQVWGHLPDRVREQVVNPTVEQFLPKYEELIKDYYKRLAEERRSGP
jgi:hypothetical protein